jgi:hypothetical protein
VVSSLLNVFDVLLYFEEVLAVILVFACDALLSAVQPVARVLGC